MKRISLLFLAAWLLPAAPVWALVLPSPYIVTSDTILTEVDGSGVLFPGTVDGDFTFWSLTVETLGGGDTVFLGPVGSTIPLFHLTTDPLGTTQIDGGLVQTLGNQVYGDPVALGAPTNIVAGGDVVFASALDGFGILTLEAAGQVDFQGSVGASVALDDLTVTAALVTLGALSPTVTTLGSQTWSAPLVLVGDTDLTGSIVVLEQAVDASGPDSLTINATSALLLGSVGAAGALANLNVSGAATLAGAEITTTGNQFYGGSVEIGQNVTLNAANVAFTSDVTSPGLNDLTINASGNTLFDQDVSGLNDLVTDAAGSTIISGSLISTFGSQTYNDAVTFGADLSLTAGSDVAFASTVDGTSSLAITAAGEVSFQGDVGGSFAPATLDVLAGQVTLGSALDVTTSGPQTWGGPMLLGGNAQLSGANVVIADSVDALAPASLTLDGLTTLFGAIGQGSPLVDLTVNGDLGLEIGAAGTDVTTTGDQTYAGDVLLGQDADLSAFDVLFAGNVSSPFNRNLTVAASGTTTFAGPVSGLGSLTSTGITEIAGGTITTLGDQTYADAVTVFGNTTLLGDNAAFNASLDDFVAGASVVDATLTGSFSAANPVGATTPPLALLLEAATLALNGATTTGSQAYTGASTVSGSYEGAGSVTFDGPVTLSGNASVSVPSGTVAIDGTVTGGAFSLDLDAGTGDVILADPTFVGIDLADFNASGNTITAVDMTINSPDYDLTAATSIDLDGAGLDGGGTTSGTLRVGVAGNGSVLVPGGENLTSTGSASLGVGGSGSAAVANSTWSLSGDLLVGDATPGSLTITVGGSVTNDVSMVAVGGLSTGTAIVDGAGSSWSMTDLYLGGGFLPAGGVGATTVSNGAALTASGLVKIWPGGTLTVDASTLSAGSMEIAGGVFDFPSGTLDLTASDLLIGTGGILGGSPSLASRVVNVVSGTTTVDLGASLVLDGGTLTSGVATRSFGSVALGGGTIGGAGAFTNDFGGTVSGSGLIDTALFNNGNLTTDALITVSGPSTNLGLIALQTGQTFRPDGGLDNFGIVELTSGVVGGSGAITNGPGGVIRGGSAVSAPVTNDGGLIWANGTGTLVISDLAGGNVNGGELRVADGSALHVVSAYASAGTVVLQGTNATLSGGILTNTGAIKGAGRVTSEVVNSGTVRAEGGELTFSALGNSNTAAGSIQAATGDTVFYTQGLLANAGTLDLTGGTFDNNGNPLTNTGSILGRGAVRTGGLTNQSLVSFADETTDVLGPVVNQATGRIEITSNLVTFFDLVTNDPGGVIKNTAGTARFLGSLANSGAFISDPADNFFDDLAVSRTGYLVGSRGDRFVIGGDLLSESEMAVEWNTLLAEVVFEGGADHRFELTAVDLGMDALGYDGNFAWGTLTLGAGASLALDGDPAAALYLHVLALEEGISQLAAIQSGGRNVYYDPAAAENGYLERGVYPLAGGGRLAPVPEPSALSLLALGLLGLAGVRRIRARAP